MEDQLNRASPLQLYVLDLVNQSQGTIVKYQSLMDESEIDELLGKKRFKGPLVGERFHPGDSVDQFLAGLENEIHHRKTIPGVANSEAGFMQYLGLGATVAGILAGTMGYSLSFIDKFMSEPNNRAIAYGAMAAAAGASALVTKGIVSSAEENIEKIDALIARFNNAADGRFDGKSLGGTRKAIPINILGPLIL